jgi:hypothetical protein
MTTFKCKRSGNTVSFLSEDDIRQMRVHEGYDEVLDTPKPIVLDELLTIEEPVKKKSTKAKSLL